MHELKPSANESTNVNSKVNSHFIANKMPKRNKIYQIMYFIIRLIN